MPNLSFAMLVCSLMLAATLTGCSAGNLHMGQGVWEIDQADFEEDLEQTCQQLLAKHPDMDTAAYREKIATVFVGSGWEFSAEGRYRKINGPFPSQGHFEVFEQGEDWIVFRLYPDTDLSDDLLDYGILNQMSVQELVRELGMRNGPAPFLVGFEFVDDTQARGFSLILRGREREITGERRYGYLYNLRH